MTLCVVNSMWLKLTRTEVLIAGFCITAVKTSEVDIVSQYFEG